MTKKEKPPPVEPGARPNDSGNIPNLTPPDGEIQPDRDAITAHLEFLFNDMLTGLIEVAWPEAGTKKWQARLFGLDQIEETVDFIVETNSVPGQQVYIGAATRNENTAPFGRTNDKDALALPAYYADLDDEGAAEAAKAIYKHCPPTAVVVTSRKPWLRVQFWWKSEDPDTDHIHMRRINSILAAALGGDPSVVNPGRIMRCGGTINWPNKKGRVLEPTEFTYTKKGAANYPNGAIEGAFSKYLETKEANSKTSLFDLEKPARTDEELTELLELTKVPTNWHESMLKVVASMLGRGWTDLQICLACAPYCRGGATDPQLIEMIEPAREKWNIPDPGVAGSAMGIPALKFHPTFHAGLCAEVIPPRQQVYPGLYWRNFVTVTGGVGGVGKTGLSMVHALVIATGEALLGVLPRRKGKVWVIVLEDDLEEARRRLQATARYFAAQRPDLADTIDEALATRIALDTAETVPLCIAWYSDDNRNNISSPHAEPLTRALKEGDFDLLIVDPYSHSDQLEENRNEDRAAVMKLWAQVASDSDCAIGLNAHFRKGSPNASPDDQDLIRGGSAIVAHARAAFNLIRMTNEEGGKFGVLEHRRYIRLAKAKANLLPPDEHTNWFEFATVDLQNATDDDPSDKIGVPVFWEPPDVWKDLSKELSDRIFARIRDGLENGERYSDSARSTDRNVHDMIVEEGGGFQKKIDEAGAKKIIKAWLKNGVVYQDEYHSPSQRKNVKGLFADEAKRPRSGD